MLDITYLEDDHVIANILDNYLSSVKPNLSRSKHFRQNQFKLKVMLHFPDVEHKKSSLC